VTHLRPRRLGRSWTAALCALAVALMTAYAGSLVIQSATAATTSTINPLAGGPWGVDAFDPLGQDWATQTGTNRSLLGKIERQSRVRWFGGGTASSAIGAKIATYIANEQAGNPHVLVPLALFNIFPGGESNRHVPMTAAQITEYSAWMKAAVAAIGSTRAVVVLQPDLAELAPPNHKTALGVPDAAVREGLVKTSAQALSKLPNATVYLDAGDADWLPIDNATTLLVNSGVQYARGFALGATHYSLMSSNVTYAKALEASLAAAGPAYANKKAILDTADNGRGFTWPYWHTHQARLGTDFDNPHICATRTTTLCDTLGHAPTWNVGSSRAPYVDGFLWFGRPWLVDQAAPYSRSRSLKAASSTPYGMVNLTGADTWTPPPTATATSTTTGP
jgi:hypothetical protein